MKYVYLVSDDVSGDVTIVASLQLEDGCTIAYVKGI